MADRDPQIDPAAGAISAEGDSAPGDGETIKRSLSDDLFDLLDDGRTYAEAELQFQKTRAVFALKMGRKAAGYTAAALLILHLAVVALAIGAIFALAPLLTAWGATALVVGVLVVAALILALFARRYFARLGKAFGEDS